MIKILLILVFVSSRCMAQEDDRLVWKAKTLVIDSSYYLITELSNVSSQDIYVRDKRYFDFGNGNQPEEISFWRVVRGRAVKFCPDEYILPIYDEVPGYKTLVNKTHPLRDTILLNHYIPLENGNYLVAVSLSHKSNSSSTAILSSGKVPLEVKFTPPSTR